MLINRTEETRIILNGNWDSEFAQRLSDSWFSAIALDHALPDQIRYMQGMSGKKYRYLINNLIKNIPDARYLEIGCWAGSTACSAIWGNKVKATCIDNWSEFGGPKETFTSNIQYCLNSPLGANIDFNFIEKDFRKIDYTTLGKYNVYMFDGPHDEKDQYDGIAIVQDALEDEYFLIVDDWNWLKVVNGTLSALESVGNRIVSSIEIKTTTNDEHPQICQENSDWHNGYFIGLISKK